MKQRKDQGVKKLQPVQTERDTHTEADTETQTDRQYENITFLHTQMMKRHKNNQSF